MMNVRTWAHTTSLSVVVVCVGVGSGVDARDDGIGEAKWTKYVAHIEARISVAAAMLIETGET